MRRTIATTSTEYLTREAIWGKIICIKSRVSRDNDYLTAETIGICPGIFRKNLLSILPPSPTPSNDYDIGRDLRYGIVFPEKNESIFPLSVIEEPG